MNFNVAILISTFDRYEPLAHWTVAQIENQWKNHPPIFFSGLQREGEKFLQFSGASSDWMGVTLAAVEKLRLRGVNYVYLILDDHPPVGACHEVFLNEQLPALAAELKASYIGLLGYGQHRAVLGMLQDKQHGYLEHCSKNDRWKFSLHPGLWNLEALELLLKHRMEIYSGKERTVWNFERHRDDPQDSVLTPLLTSCYRVAGHYFLKEPGKAQWTIIKNACMRFVADLILYGTKKLSGQTARDAMERHLLWLYNQYLGPYPIFWSGSMQQGKPHRSWEQWLKFSGNHELHQSWSEVKKKL